MSETNIPSGLPVNVPSLENEPGTKLIRLSISDELRNSYLT